MYALYINLKKTESLVEMQGLGIHFMYLVL